MFYTALYDLRMYCLIKMRFRTRRYIYLQFIFDIRFLKIFPIYLWYILIAINFLGRYSHHGGHLEHWTWVCYIVSKIPTNPVMNLWLWMENIRGGMKSNEAQKVMWLSPWFQVSADSNVNWQYYIGFWGDNPDNINRYWGWNCRSWLIPNLIPRFKSQLGPNLTRHVLIMQNGWMIK